MNRALWLLLWLQLAGWGRFLAGQLKTVRGALLFAVAMVFLLPYLVAVAMAGGVGTVPRENLDRYGPVFLLLYVVSNLLFSSHDRPVYFTPAETQFLFAGPFSRREVLLYKVLLTLLATLPATLVVGLLLRVQQGWLPGVAVGLLLMLVFLQLFSLAVGLLATAAGASLHTRGRQVLAAVLVLGLVLTATSAAQTHGWDARRLGEAALDSTAWKVASWPLGAFFRAMTARTWAELAVPAVVGTAVNAALLLLLFGLNASYYEQSAAASAYFYARLLRARGQSVTVEPVAGKEKRARFTLPMFPYLGGAGPIFWRQLVTALRSLGRLAVVLVILGLVLAVPLMTGRRSEGRAEVLVGAGMVVLWLSIFLPTLVPFDFRGDIDRMATLKVLPIPAWRIALGQMLAPTLLMSVVHWLMLLAAVISLPEVRPYAVMGVVAAPVFNFYLMAVENVLFLLFPVRVQAATPGDFQAMGRNILQAVGKMLGLVVPVGAVLMGVLFGALTQSAWVGVAVGCGITAAVSVLLVAVAGVAFEWYDVGRNAPA